jgi:hypothetical protein
MIVIMLNVIMLNVIMLNVIMLNVIMLNVIMLTVIMLSVVMLSVVAHFLICKDPDFFVILRSLPTRKVVLSVSLKGYSKNFLKSSQDNFFSFFSLTQAIN